MADEYQPRNEFLEGVKALTLSDTLRRGWNRLKDVGTEIGANYQDLGKMADMTPTGLAMAPLKSAVLNYRRAKATEAGTGGDVPSFSEDTSIMHSSDPSVRAQAMVLDPSNYVGAGAIAKVGSKVLTPIRSRLVRSGEDKLRSSIANRLRSEAPDIYQPPREIAAQAAKNTEPESPALKEVWGTTREELADTANRAGNITDPRLIVPGWAMRPSGTKHGSLITTPENSQRILETIEAVKKHAPEMYTGMKGWYVTDPKFKRLVDLVGPEEAVMRMKRGNVFQATESPFSPVEPEIRRAAAANYAVEQGRFPEWKRYGGTSADERERMNALMDALAAGKPALPGFETVPGRMGHVRPAQGMENYLATGEHGMKSPKAPPYALAHGTPETGFQTSIPIPDTHWSTAVGLGDVRGGATPYKSASTAELQELTPWWKREVADPAGLEPVPAQAITWGAFGKQTGVKSKVGAPKLELEANLIKNRALQIGDTPQNVRDRYLVGKEHLGFMDMKTALGLGGVGAAGGYGIYKVKKFQDERDARLKELMQEAERAANPGRAPQPPPQK